VAEPDITLVLDPHVEFCQGGFPEVRLWDNSSGRMWSHTSWLNVPIAPDAMLLEKSIIHATVFCRVGVGMYEGYMSTSITNSSIGSDAANIGVHVFINGEERPAFICWDTPDPHTDPMLHRIQFRIGDWDDPPGCYAGG
jgi:hypothetical protein